MAGRHHRSATVPCAPPLLSPPARLGLGIGRVLGTSRCGLLRGARWTLGFTGGAAAGEPRRVPRHRVRLLYFVSLTGGSG